MLAPSNRDVQCAKKQGCAVDRFSDVWSHQRLLMPVYSALAVAAPAGRAHAADAMAMFGSLHRQVRTIFEERISYAWSTK